MTNKMKLMILGLFAVAGVPAAPGDSRASLSPIASPGKWWPRWRRRPQTAEILKTFGESCQKVIVTNVRDRADYVVTLDHEGGKGWARKDNKFAVFNKEGDMVGSGSTRSLGNSVRDACQAMER